MAFHADIVVTNPDSPEVLLVATVQGAVVDLSTEAELKSYMVERGCPVGMLVTPAEVRFYRNRYIDYSPQAIHLIAECPTSLLLGAFGKQAPSEWELRRWVLDWLENLQVGGSNPSWPPAVREAIEANVFPSVISGTVRAGVPWQRRAS